MFVDVSERNMCCNCSSEMLAKWEGVVIGMPSLKKIEKKKKSCCFRCWPLTELTGIKHLQLPYQGL